MQQMSMGSHCLILLLVPVVMLVRYCKVLEALAWQPDQQQPELDQWQS
jgi:hypothetical protein